MNSGNTHTLRAMDAVSFTAKALVPRQSVSNVHNNHV